MQPSNTTLPKPSGTLLRVNAICQEAIVAELDRDGHDTNEALKVLATIRATQALHEQDVKRLLKQLGQ